MVEVESVEDCETSVGAVDFGDATLSTLTSSSIAVLVTVTPPNRLPSTGPAPDPSWATAYVAEAMKPTQESARKAGFLARSLLGIESPLLQHCARLLSGRGARLLLRVARNVKLIANASHHRWGSSGRAGDGLALGGRNRFVPSL